MMIVLLFVFFNCKMKHGNLTSFRTFAHSFIYWSWISKKLGAVNMDSWLHLSWSWKRDTFPCKGIPGLTTSALGVN